MILYQVEEKPRCPSGDGRAVALLLKATGSRNRERSGPVFWAGGCRLGLCPTQ